MITGIFMKRLKKGKPVKVTHDVNEPGQFLVPVWHTVVGSSRKRAQSAQLTTEHLEAKKVRRYRVRKAHSVMVTSPKTIEMSILKTNSMFAGNILDKEAIGHTLIEG